MAVDLTYTSHVQTGGTVMAEQPENLLHTLATRRDDATFTELCKKYEKHAFNVAYRILQDPALAEDAVQDALLAIWQRAAAAFEPGGSEEAWILRVVANKSLDLRRRLKHKTMREERMAAVQPRRDDHAADAMESREMIDKLRTQIDALPELERALLTCSYCTSMPHREIGKLLGISQSSVSEKIQQVLKRLRLELTGAGLAAALPLFNQETLFAAITSGRDCPPGLTERVATRIKAQEQAQPRARSRKAVSTKVVWALGTLVVIAGAAFGISNMGGGGTPAAPAMTVSNEKPYYAHWTFEKDAPSDLRLSEGEWHWQNGSKTGTAGMLIATDRPTLIVLPHLFAPGPYQITIKGVLNAEGATLGSMWFPNTGLGQIYNWNVPHKTLDVKRFTMTEYVIGRTIADYLGENQLCSVAQYEREYPSQQLAVGGKSVILQELEVRALTANEIPQALRDPEKLIRELPAGSVVSSSIPNVKPGKP